MISTWPPGVTRLSVWRHISTTITDPSGRAIGPSGNCSPLASSRQAGGILLICMGPLFSMRGDAFQSPVYQTARTIIHRLAGLSHVMISVVSTKAPSPSLGVNSALRAPVETTEIITCDSPAPFSRPANVGYNHHTKRSRSRHGPKDLGTEPRAQ